MKVPISIVTADGVAVTTIIVRPTMDTVQQVFSQIGLTMQIPVNELRLLFAGRELERDESKLAEHGVVRGSTLHLVKTARLGRSKDC